MITAKEDKNIIDQIIDNKHFVLKDKKVCIFGCTPYARTINDRLAYWKIHIFAIIDNNLSKCGKKCMGIRIHAPEEILVPFDSNLVVIVCSKYSYEMKKQIQKYGYSTDNIVDIDVFESNDAYYDLDSEFESAIKNVKNGVKLYQNIIGEHDCLFLCPYAGTGDVYMACSYLDIYLRKRRIHKYKILVLSENGKKVAGLFGFENTQVVSELEKNLLLAAWEFLGSAKIRLKPLLHWGWRTKKFLYSDNHKNITFNEMFKYDVFGLEKSDRMNFPQKKSNKKKLGELTNYYNIKKGTSVILAPYAGSFVSDISENEWEQIAEILIEKGYTVYTNAYGTENVISKTYQIQFSYDLAVDIVEYAGTFIGIRSGLCDIISSADAQLIIFYENGFNASSIDFFGLKNMGLNSKVSEVVADNKNVLLDIVSKLL